MKRKIVIGLCGVGLLTLTAFASERRKNMFGKEKKNEVIMFDESLIEHAPDEVEAVGRNLKRTEMSDAEKAQLANVVRGMTEEETLLVLSSIPMSTILKHIDNEFKKNQSLIRSINEAMDILK